MHEITFVDLGTSASYLETLELQRSTRQKLIEGKAPQTIFLCEHPPTITLGKGANPAHLLLPREDLESQGYSIFEVERGGEVTYHGPGQIVCYPVLDLNLYKRDIGWYMRLLEAIIMQVLSSFNIDATRIPGEAGVWITSDSIKKKIASVGVHLSRWRTIHGLALNYAPQHAKFSVINPCGFTNIVITSITEELTTTHKEVSYPVLKSMLQKSILDSLR